MSNSDVDLLKKIIEYKEQQAVGADLIRPIVPIEDWVNDSYYLGPNGANLYQFWKDRLIEVFKDPRHPINEVIVTGGLGCRPLLSYIATDQGYVRYCDLDEHLTDLQVRTTEGMQHISSLQKVGLKNCVEIHFFDGTVYTCTNDHKIRAANGKWKQAFYFKAGDIIPRYTVAEPVLPEGSIDDAIVKQAIIIAKFGRYHKDEMYRNPLSFLKGFFSVQPSDIKEDLFKSDVIDYLTSYGFQVVLLNGIVSLSVQHASILASILGLPFIPSTGKPTESYYYVKIKSVKYLNDVDCCDISVPAHTYYCNGFLNHNTGKSTFGLYCIIRKLYELSCYKRIPALFGLMDITTIALIYFTVSLKSAMNTGFGTITKYIDSIPYFREHFQRDMNMSTMLKFPENLIMTYGSSETHSIGMNLIGSILDEANFFNSSSDYSKVANMYNTILNRSQSRFKNKNQDASLCVLISSNTTTSSFVESRIAEAINNPNALIINGRLWDVKPHEYGNDRFYVFTGSDLIDPYIIDTPEDVYMFTDTLGLPRVEGSVEEIINAFPQAKPFFTDVPLEFRERYNSDVIRGLQDYSGISVAPIGRLFSSNKVFNDCLSSDLAHPFTKEQIVCSTGDDVQIQEYLKPDWEPLNREKARFIHVDQSVAHDSTGLAMSYIDSWSFDDKTQTYSPHIVTELMLKINPPKHPNRLSIKKVRDFILYMRERFNLNFGYVSYDSYACLTPDTLITTSKGNIPLRDIKIGDLVYNENGLCRVKNKVRYDNALICKVTLANGMTISGTPNHKVHAMASTWNSDPEYVANYDKSRLWSNVLFYGNERPVWNDVCLHYLVAGDSVLDVNPIKPSYFNSEDFVVVKKEFLEDENTGEDCVGTVYDLSIEFCPYYIANNIYVHNSQESLQVLDSLRIPSGNVSVDRSDEPYLTLVSLLFEGRVGMYDYKPMREELFKLVHYRDKHKVDHLDAYSKDVCDAWCASVWNALTHCDMERPSAFNFPLVQSLADVPRFGRSMHSGIGGGLSGMKGMSHQPSIVKENFSASELFGNRYGHSQGKPQKKEWFSKD